MYLQTEKRPILAALLSFIQPGIGHLYLREWVRAALWAGLWVGALGLVVTTAEISLSTLDIVAAVFGAFALVDSFTTQIVVSLYSVKLFATLDAYWLAVRRNQTLDAGVRCPHCKRELDPTLDFCHWCTTSFDTDDGA